MKLISIIIVSLFILLSSVSSKLTPTQTTTMISLLDHLRNQTPSLPWNGSDDPCSPWTGVICKNVTVSDSSVIGLSLSNYGLTDSSFLPVVCQINTLEDLDVSKNSLTSIPDEFFTSCGEIQGLKLVNFSNNRLAGSLHSFGNGFTSLQSLDMAYNSLAGSVETQFSSLVSLKSLNLSYNNFTGSIPANTGKDSMVLEQLLLSTNQFKGVIPEKLAKYENLTALDLSSNLLFGSVPAFLGNLLKLELLVLSNNSLKGEVPENISRITTLKRFAANQNSLSGKLPAGISNYVSSLDLSYNNLSGSIPDDFLSNPNLTIVDISYNRLEGNIPAKVSLNLFRLRAGGNLLDGSISPIKFVDLKKLQYLELDNNRLSGTIPSELGSCRNLRLLNLAVNNFSGGLPIELGDLKNLTVLKLQVNKLSGVIPDEITQLTNLSTLNISWNSLSGSIPPSVSALSNLAFLHLQNNNLTGLIPGSIGRLNKLIELQLGKNYLSGNIVSLPANLQYSLNLSHNLFDGPIPNAIGQLSSVEILDLSYNRFSGRIPDFLTELETITLLMLNNNNLSGEFPKFPSSVVVDSTGNQFTVPPYSNPDQRKKLPTVKIAVGISAVFFGGLIAFLGVFISRRFFCRAHDLEVQPYSNDESPLPVATEYHILTTNSIHKANINFKKAMEAAGNPLNMVLNTKFSTYYKAVMPSGRSYFVKKINCSDRIIIPSSHESFGKDLEMLGKLNSSNIMIPLAYMLTPENAYLFYELAFKGTLYDVLHRSYGIPLDWVSRCTIAVGLAQGLTYLHGCSTGPILLFDLACKTVMLKSLKEPQIGDIELCKIIDPSKNTTSLSAVAGSVGYIPPEYAYTMRVTKEGNVYSFGVILLELVTGKQAVSEGTELAKWVWSNSRQPQKLDRILDYGVGRTSQAIKIQMLAVLNIALACINASSEARPKMKSVLRMLLNVR